MNRNSKIPQIMGYYSAPSESRMKHSPKVLEELALHTKYNLNHQNNRYIFAGDKDAQILLTQYGLNDVILVDPAPLSVRNTPVHRMKHWMCIQALELFDEFIWFDWDTIQFQNTDENFHKCCRKDGTPKFIYLPNYEYGVNCGIYYTNREWLSLMRKSLENPHFNDEMLWMSILPGDVLSDKRFFWGSEVVNIYDINDPVRQRKELGYTERQLNKIKPDTYFAHVSNIQQSKNLYMKFKSFKKTG